MTDPILDDVKALLDKEVGDKHILEQIQRAAENDEVISNYERNYVSKLAEQHLDRKPFETVSEKPDAEIPTEKPQTTIQYQQQPVIRKSNPKNTKIFAGIGIAVLAIIVVGVMYGMTDKPDIVEPIPAITDDVTSNSIISIQTDLTSYTKGDIISISGKSDFTLGDTIKLSIKNTDGETIWAEEITVKDDGSYSTLTFAGGFGWDTDGIFTLNAEHGEESESKTFSFKD